MGDEYDELSTAAARIQDPLIVMGRSSQLGGYYDVVNEIIFPPAISVTDDDIETELVSNVEVVACSSTDIWEQLEVDPEMRLKILLGMCETENGIAKIPQIFDRKCEHAFLIYKNSQVKKSIKIGSTVSSMGSLPDGATHFIRSVEFGAWVVFHFQYPRAGDKVQSLLSELVEKVPNMRTIRSLQTKERTFAKSIKCDVYSNLSQLSLAQNFEEAVELFQKLPELTEGADEVVKGNAEPICCLAPLPIDDSTASNIAKNILGLMEFRQACEQFMNSTVFDNFENLRKKIISFDCTVNLYLDYVTADIAQRVKQVKTERRGMGLLKQVVTLMDESPFQVGSLDIWISDLAALENMIFKAANSTKFARKGIICRTGESKALIKAEDPAHIVAIFHVGFTQQELEHIVNMNKYLLGINVVSVITEPELAVLQGSTTAMNEKLKTILNIAPDKEHSNVMIITDDVSENQALLNLYQNGELLTSNFIPPTKMDAPNCTNVTHETIQVTWTELDRESTPRYEVNVKKDFETVWGKVIVGFSPSGVTVKCLCPGQLYCVRIRPLSILGPAAFSPETAVITQPSGKPSRPKPVQVSTKGIMLSWYPAEDITANHYRWFKSRQGSLSWKVEVKTGENDLMIVYSAVKPEETPATLYIEPKGNKVHQFRVCACCHLLNENRKKVQVEGQYSEWSDEFSMNASPSDIVKNKAFLSSIKVHSGNPATLNLRTKCNFTNKDLRHRKFYYGKQVSGVPMKTILMVGATGAGKSTLINSLVNYVLNVQWEDDFRFRLVRENLNADHANSQTKWVTAYTLYHQKGFNIPYSLTIIDTPGFGDTAGIEADKRITQQLSDYFHTRGHEGIDSLDAIGFVVEASRSRLTATQIYIFDSILALFGKDISENIFVLITFADGQKPPVMDGLKKADLPYTQAFKFNNSAVFAKKRNQGDDHDEDEFEDDNQSFNEMFWRMGAQSYQKFLSSLQKTSPKSLTLTNAVLDERRQLETFVVGIQQEIRAGLYKLEELRRGLNCLYDYEASVDRNKDYTFQVPVQKINKIMLEPRTYVTNCLNCNVTCHYPCGIPQDKDKMHCWAMDRSRSNLSACRICVGNCHWSLHHNMEYRFEFEEIIETRTAEDLKRQYEEAYKAKLTTEEVIEKMLDDVQATEIRTGLLTEEVRKSLERLNEIALRPNHMTTVDYIDVLIQSERDQAERGWQHRVDQLKAVRERADMLNKVAEKKGITDIWNGVKKAIQEDAEEKKKVGFSGKVKNCLRKLLHHIGFP